MIQIRIFQMDDPNWKKNWQWQIVEFDKSFFNFTVIRYGLAKSPEEAFELANVKYKELEP